MIFEFAIASLVLIALPGPDQALIMRNALVGGRAAGVRTMLGGVTGLALHASAALGVSALLATSAAAYATLKLVGVPYLLYLGVRMLLSARKPPEPEQEARGGRPFLQGSCRTR
jgi:threonine/homoserine/homoserine lactone efflux protein